MIANGRVNNDTHNVLPIAACDTINWGTPLSSSNESRVIRKNNGVSPIKSLQRNLRPFEKKEFPAVLLLFISLSFASMSSEDLFKSPSSKSHLLHGKQVGIYRTANQGAFLVFPEERFLLHLT